MASLLETELALCKERDALLERLDAVERQLQAIWWADDFPDLTPPTPATSEAGTIRLGDCAIRADLPR